MPLSRARTLGLSPKREPILVKVSPSAAANSNSPPTIRCASEGNDALGGSAIAGAEGGVASDEGAGVAAGLASDALAAVAASVHRRNAATTAQLSFGIEAVTLVL